MLFSQQKKKFKALPKKVRKNKPNNNSYVFSSYQFIITGWQIYHKKQDKSGRLVYYIPGHPDFLEQSRHNKRILHERLLFS